MKERIYKLKRNSIMNMRSILSVIYLFSRSKISYKFSHIFLLKNKLHNILIRDKYTQKYEKKKSYNMDGVFDF